MAVYAVNINEIIHSREKTYKIKWNPMKINHSNEKKWHTRINEYVELCADRRDSNSCRQLKEKKSKLLTENEMGHLVQKSYFCQTLTV